jgi:uncharacterized membrane protein (UPF0127 family)
MKKHILDWLITAACVVLVGLWAYRTFIAPHGRPPVSSGWSPPGAQAKLPSVKLWLGSQELAAEVASTRDEIQTGLMFRTNLASNDAMLFALPVPQRAEFYMRNTLIPLSCAYIDEDGVILETHDMKPRDETVIPSATATVRYVLEVNRGWFESNHVAAGTVVRTEQGPLRKSLREAPY